MKKLLLSLILVSIITSCVEKEEIIPDFISGHWIVESVNSRDQIAEGYFIEFTDGITSYKLNYISGMGSYFLTKHKVIIEDWDTFNIIMFQTQYDDFLIIYNNTTKIDLWKPKTP